MPLLAALKGNDPEQTSGAMQDQAITLFAALTESDTPPTGGGMLSWGWVTAVSGCRCCGFSTGKSRARAALPISPCSWVDWILGTAPPWLGAAQPFDAGCCTPCRSEPVFNEGADALRPRRGKSCGTGCAGEGAAWLITCTRPGDASLSANVISFSFARRLADLEVPAATPAMRY